MKADTGGTSALEVLAWAVILAVVLVGLTGCAGVTVDTVVQNTLGCLFMFCAPLWVHGQPTATFTDCIPSQSFCQTATAN